MKEGDSSFSFIINTKQGLGTWTKRWTLWTWSLAFGTRVLSSWSWGLHGSRYSIQVLVAVSKHGWAEVPPRASNVLQSHHHRRVYSVLPLSSARWDPSAHDVVSQHSSSVRMLGECCPTSRDLALSVEMALIQHFATPENHAYYYVCCSLILESSSSKVQTSMLAET